MISDHARRNVGRMPAGPGQLVLREQLETAAEIAARVRDALRFFDPSRVWLNPDCGFGTFAERPVATAQVAAAKLRAIAGAAEMLRSS